MFPTRFPKQYHISIVLIKDIHSHVQHKSHVTIRNWTGITMDLGGSRNATRVIFQQCMYQFQWLISSDLMQKQMVFNSLIKWFNHGYRHQIWKYFYCIITKIDNFASLLNLCSPRHSAHHAMWHGFRGFEVGQCWWCIIGGHKVCIFIVCAHNLN